MKKDSPLLRLPIAKRREFDRNVMDDMGERDSSLPLLMTTFLNQLIYRTMRSFTSFRMTLLLFMDWRREAGAFRTRVDRVKKNLYETPLLPSSQ